MLIPYLQWLRAQRRRHASASRWLLVALAAALVLETCLHQYAYHVASPRHDLDGAFATGCREQQLPDPAVAPPRANAVLVMLARNAEARQAHAAVESVERAFNRRFHYPMVFLNDEVWDAEAVRLLNATTSGPAAFEVVPRAQWTFPAGVDVAAARLSIDAQGAGGGPYAGREGYHHMCRFFSGNFYQLDALKHYKWYWRIEPDVEFSCAITYDPFVLMARNEKVYGYVNALWEVGTTCPSLFRATADWMHAQALEPTGLWKAMIEASWAPWPFRRLMSLLAHRDRYGDAWSLCHYWSNFEIADLDFFRSKQYQDLFRHLDAQGGFYFERWGDAAVHSLAVAMFLQPHQVHHFDDMGYRHGKFYQCPANAPGGQLFHSISLGNGTLPEGNPEAEGGLGCRCQCDRRPDGVRNYSGYCANRLKKPTAGRQSWVNEVMPGDNIPFFRVCVAGAVLTCILLVIPKFASRGWCSRCVSFGGT